MAGVTVILQVNLKKGKSVKKLHPFGDFQQAKREISNHLFGFRANYIYVTLKNS